MKKNSMKRIFSILTQSLCHAHILSFMMKQKVPVEDFYFHLFYVLHYSLSCEGTMTATTMVVRTMTGIAVATMMTTMTMDGGIR